MGSTAQHSNSKLFEPLQIGNCKLSNRVVMAPLTRFRADSKHVQHSYVKDYYTQRGCEPGTLLITEATFVSPRASGYNNVPGIWNDEQCKAWKEVTDSVHKAGSYMYLQLWAIGRTGVPDVLKADGQKFLSSSAVPMSDNSPTPEEMTEEEIQLFIQDFAQGAKNAVEKAGFDGVEIHGANGYVSISTFPRKVW